jgi:uncharacterized membrane protein
MAEQRTKTPVSRTPGQPPQLKFHVVRQLKLLLLLNILPLACSIYLYWHWRMGNLTFKPMSDESRSLLFAVIIAGASFAVLCWFIFPLINWLRDYPTWHMRHSHWWLWLVPTLAGWLLWTIIGLIGIIAGVTAVLYCVLGIWRLFVLAGSA